MRWFMLLTVICVIFWSANEAYHQMSQAFLITDHWITKDMESVKPWGLISFQGEEPQLHAFTGSNGLWSMFKALWPVWTLFTSLFIGLIPIAVYIYRNVNDAQIAAAKEAQIEAEKRARKAESDAKIFEQKTTSWAEERVNAAYQEQLSRVKKEFEAEWDSFHKQKNQVLERESEIQNRERTTQQMEKSAKERVENIIEQYNQEKSQFEAEMNEMARARDNAQSGQRRLRKEKEMVRDFLSHQGWTIGEEPLTYEKLKSLSKAKQP